MNWSKTPRRNKIIILSAGTVALALVLGIAVTFSGQQSQIGADTSTLTLDDPDFLTAADAVAFTVEVKKNGQAVTAFADAISCVNPNDGYTGETTETSAGATDGRVDFSLPPGGYVLKADAKDGSGTISKTIVVGDGSADLCEGNASSVQAGDTVRLDLKAS